MKPNVIILAGGRGTRLAEKVPGVPKPLAKIMGRPFLEYVLDHLLTEGIESVTLATGYLGSMISEHFGDKYRGMSLCYSIETEPLGTGGAVRRAIEKSESDWVLVGNGDTYLEFSLAEVLDRATSEGSSLVLTSTVENAKKFNTLSEKNGRVEMNAKGHPGPARINAGWYYLKKEELVEFPPDVAFSMEEDFLVPSLRDGKLRLHEVVGRFIDIGTPEDFARASQVLLENDF